MFQTECTACGLSVYDLPDDLGDRELVRDQFFDFADDGELYCNGNGCVTAGEGVPVSTDNTQQTEIVRRVEQALHAAFSGDEYEDNASDAAGEAEWSWWKWLALNTVREAQPGPCGCTRWPCHHPDNTPEQPGN